MTPRALSDTVRGRGIGVTVGAAIGAGWAVFGLHMLGVTSIAAVLPALLIAASVILMGIRIVRLSRTLPRADAAGQKAGRRRWRLFWFNLAGEIVLLNIAALALGHWGAVAYLIPAISLVVGLHFLPMAIFFDAPDYWFTGFTMMALAALAAAAIAIQIASATTIIGGEALLNALILWGTGIVGYFRARRVADTA